MSSPADQALAIAKRQIAAREEQKRLEKSEKKARLEELGQDLMETLQAHLDELFKTLSRWYVEHGVFEGHAQSEFKKLQSEDFKEVANSLGFITRRDRGKEKELCLSVPDIEEGQMITPAQSMLRNYESKRVQGIKEEGKLANDACEVALEALKAGNFTAEKDACGRILAKIPMRYEEGRVFNESVRLTMVNYGFKNVYFPKGSLIILLKNDSSETQ